MKKATLITLVLLLFLTTGCMSLTVQDQLAATECKGELMKTRLGTTSRYFCRTPDGGVRTFKISDWSGKITYKRVIFEPDQDK